MSPELAKNLIKEYVCTKKSAIYFPNDEDFLIFQRAFTEIISPNNFKQLLRCTTKNLLCRIQRFILKETLRTFTPGYRKNNQFV